MYLFLVTITVGFIKNHNYSNVLSETFFCRSKQSDALTVGDGFVNKLTLPAEREEVDLNISEIIW